MNIDIALLKKAHLIPIGLDCWVAHPLRDWGVRKHALPFDWNVSPLDSIAEIISTDFAHFMDYEDLRFSVPKRTASFDDSGDRVVVTTQLKSLVLNVRTNMIFPHDFSSSSMADFLLVQRKYQKRIERFRSLLLDDVPVVFIYSNNIYTQTRIDEYACFDIAVDKIKPSDCYLSDNIDIIFNSIRKVTGKQIYFIDIESVKTILSKNIKMKVSRFVRRKKNRILKNIKSRAGRFK